MPTKKSKPKSLPRLSQKIGKASRRREMAKRAVQETAANIRQACEAFSISQTCYRYEPKLSAENERIAGWLLRLTHNQRNWGFGLCFLYLRNVKGFGWTVLCRVRTNQ